ncbi:MAG: hypothetical protein PS018_14235 [bacterium]|nr:hypothetical protein [bacterium]
MLVTLMAFSIPCLFRSLDRAGGLQTGEWSSSSIWVRSAECARTTKGVLVLCKDGRLVPIADVSAGDDPGPALAMAAYAALTGAVVVEADVSRANTILNYVGIAALAALLFSLRMPWLSFLVLTGGAAIANQFHFLGPHPGHFGVACLAALLPLAILGAPPASPSRWLWWLWIALGLAGLAIGMVFREAIGLMGVLSSLLALGLGYSLQAGKMRYAALVHIVVGSAVILTIGTPYAILRARDAVLHIAPSDRMEQHGAWHNLYIGLGVVENPFGIVWNDEHGVQTVKRVDPAVKYLSAEYYAILKREYFRLVLSHPLDVAIIYLRKLAVALKTYKMWLVLIVAAVVLAFARIALMRRLPGWTTFDAVIMVSWIFVATFLGQAALFNYVELYLFPIKLFLLLLSGAAVELLFRLWCQKTRLASTEANRVHGMP